MRLKSVRTNQIFKVIEQKNGIYKIQLEDGSVKELAESTVKRWYKVIEEDKTVNEPKSPRKGIKVDVNRKVEPKELDSSLVEKGKRKYKRGISSPDLKRNIVASLNVYISENGLCAKKRKQSVCVFTRKEGGKKVFQIQSGRNCIRLSVRPMVYLMLKERDQKKCIYLNDKCNMHFRTVFLIKDMDDLDFAKELIRLSLKDLED